MVASAWVIVARQSSRSSSYRTVARGRSRVRCSMPSIMVIQPMTRVVLLVRVP